MKIKDLRANFTNSLSGIYDSEEILSFFYILSEEILGLKRVDVAMCLDKTLTVNEKTNFDNAIKRLEKQEPIQYIIGETYFFGIPFIVNEHVLIPRPETEELVDWILKDQKKEKQSITILDIGTGSGCIAISLAKKIPEAKVYAIDISEKAIQVAKENARKNHVEVTFINADVLEIEDLFQDFDIIVSNPPYVRELEKKEMKSNVLDNEPEQALFVSDNEPLLFYEKITDLTKGKLRENGSLYFEINQYLGIETKSMIESKGFKSVEVRKDIYDNERMIRARLN
ncbi:release factor glutamine methyltransferase [Aquimarina sp. EL_43]|uniref:peptide chain release factor N(5)-glutamine methyltransferase n=1 Tax=Aquimarina TaxID=290174 RepID=UPI00046FA66E|nr:MULTISPECIES: peptide chain release factor N(5)-glutamine methyltransferase [Aquimarina]MBG6132079.1 release factor glutamine methyltransferase [Aquimarina sp. EL_35]MBG6152876.1 release factor glutamine methyltransferase [Aquimarina sp. EL_32]MBG6170883.1 release factor glutamine methyltransferase [Aquimarina sp. EL_43]